MEIIKKNYLNTSTMISVQSATALAENIMTRTLNKQWISTGYANDLTTTTLTVDFGETLTVSRIIMTGINLKSFTVFYDGTTANTFAISGGDTTVSDWATNSNTAIYLTCSTVSCQTISIDMKTTQLADSEKAISWFVASDLKMTFDRLPAANGYDAVLNAEEVVHKLSDGGTRINIKDYKYSANIKLNYIQKDFRDNIYTLWDEKDEFIFVSFGTSTGWDGLAFPAVYVGNFNFYKYADNAPQTGFNGTISLRETPT